uniref:Uncharacterized protein n=1 Tax=Setaria viridis TaxID=4556 RepID=A0A4U6TJF8_SETVI|nr:hypothetical protein SEVIR_8G250900v2 [Setaria viridis]
MSPSSLRVLAAFFTPNQADLISFIRCLDFTTGRILQSPVLLTRIMFHSSDQFFWSAILSSSHNFESGQKFAICTCLFGRTPVSASMHQSIIRSPLSAMP